MERILLVLAGAMTVIMLLFATLGQNVEERPDLSSMSQVDPDDEWFKTTVLESDQPVLVKFTADWCGYCKQLDVVLKDIEKDYGDRIKIVPVDVDEHPKVAQAYQVTGLPLILVMKDRKVLAYGPGMMRYETVESLIKPHLAGKQDRSSSAPKEAPEGETSTALSAVALQ